MKQITKNQMKKLKGKLSEMNYSLSDLSNATTTTLDSGDDVCKVKNYSSDID